VLQGADCDAQGRLVPSEEMAHGLARMTFEWRRAMPGERENIADACESEAVEVPVYADESRKLLLFHFEMQTQCTKETFVESSIALIAK
jgi:hypothetical protein